MHNISNNLIQNASIKYPILITTHQLVEIYYALTFKGRINRKDVLNIIEKISRSSRTLVIEVNLKLSSLSGIHLWDYLCVIPLKGLIDIAYTNDKHFLDKTSKNLVPKVENPVGKWISI